MAVRSGTTLGDIPVALRSLGAGLPEPLRRALGLEPKRLLLDLSAERMTAQIYDGSRAGARQSVDLMDAAAGAVLRELASRPLDEIVLRLGADVILATELVLPNTATRALAALMPFEFDRLAPLPLDQLFHGYEILAAGPPALRVAVQMAPRAPVVEILARLETLGVQPDRLIGPGDGLVLTRFNLLPIIHRPAKPRSFASSLGWGLAGLALLAAAASPFAHLLWQRASILAEIAALGPGLAAQREAAKARGLEGVAAERARQAMAGKTAQVPAVVVVDAMTKLLPDDAWLTQFNLAAGRIEIEGHARAATALVPLLEASPYFGDVRFVTPVTRDTASGRERFHFTIALKTAPAVSTGP